MNKQLTALITWLDRYLLLILAGFLLAFIPLNPKIPIYSPIEQYIVRVRLEDIAIAFAGLVWFMQWWRKKVVWNTPITQALVAYAIAGLLSIVSGLIITQTIPFETIHLGKSTLHWFRYLEYFSLFFIVLGSIKKRRDILVLVGVLLITTLAVSFYGYGQKNWYWPVYSTMNREFSKGIRLYLTEHARVQSTFAGHYDLGAYLALTLPITLALGLAVRKRWKKILFWAVHMAGLWLLIVSASRAAFAGYLLAITVVIGIFAWKKKSWGQKVSYAFTRQASVTFIVFFMLLKFGGDMYDRFLQVLAAFPETHNRYHTLNGQRKEYTELFLIGIGWQKWPMPKIKSIEPPKNGVAVNDIDGQIVVKTDQQPTPNRPGTPRDVYVDVPDIVEVVEVNEDGSTTVKQVEKPRTYTSTAERFGLSMAIRLDALWPQAIAGFLKNPLNGSGYATLNKTAVEQFTEADSTDNNYLRTLGENGLLGFVTFYGAIILGIAVASRLLQEKDPLMVGLAAGYIAGTIGLLLNATYIDVFAASKVAQTFWALTGLVAGTFYLNHTNAYSQNKQLQAFISAWPWQKSTPAEKPETTSVSKKTTKTKKRKKSSKR